MVLFTRGLSLRLENVAGGLIEVLLGIPGTVPQLYYLQGISFCYVVSSWTKADSSCSVQMSSCQLGAGIAVDNRNFYFIDVSFNQGFTGTGCEAMISHFVFDPNHLICRL
jgi:hypothetical protein